MKFLILLSLMLSTQAFAKETNTTFECAVKKLYKTSPEWLRMGDTVRFELSYIDSDKQVDSKKISKAYIADKKVTGNVRYTKFPGNFPHSYSFSSKNRLVLSLEVSKSEKNARIRSLSLSTASGGYPVVANLSCVKL